MGFGGISIWQLLIVLAIVVMIFGTKKLRNMGGDLGSAIKGFKNAVGNDEDKNADKKPVEKVEANTNSADTTSNADAAKSADKQKEVN